MSAADAGAAAAENPFAQDVSEERPGPTSLVIFGASGDLAARKLIPAVYNLLVGGLLPDRLRVIGVDLVLDDFPKTARAAIEAHSRTDFNEEAWKELEPRLEAVKGDFSDPGLFSELADRLAEGDKDGATQRVFYLAVAPRFFGPIAKSLNAAGLGAGAEPPTKLVIEKPFGHDLESGLELNADVGSAFDENQVFRIDHYLGKETVQNLLVLRFANGIFEPVWNRRYVEQVQITVAEDLGVGHRGGYYDSAGAIRDIVQNHMMQLVALTAMEAPARFEADSIRDEKVKLLRAIRHYKPEEVGDFVVRGQYDAGWVGGEEVKAYRNEDGIPKGSTNDTYVAARLEIDNWRWAGTPFYVRTGKQLPRKVTEIAVRFRPVPHLAFAKAEVAGVAANELVLAVQPDEGASLSIVAKIPGQTMNVRPVQMEFQYGTTFLAESPEAYERLLHDAIRGEATLFTRSDEVEAEWRIVDPILEAWKTGPPPVPYEAGSQGPKEADELLAIRGREWRQI
ncbi:MAG: glucose-6-phosphate dehydrogenase [Solirubrobacterales bacterium]